MNLFGYRSRISGLDKEKSKKQSYNQTYRSNAQSFSEVLASLGAECWKRSPSEEVKSVNTDQDITISVNLQQVAIHGVKHKAPKRKRK